MPPRRAPSRPRKTSRQPEIGLGTLRASIPFHLRLAQNASFAAFARAAGEYDLRPGWYSILQIIEQNPGLSPTALSRTSGRDKSTLTPALTQLEAYGLIVRQRAQHDGRAQHVHLTHAGRVRLKRLATHAARHDRMLAQIVGRGATPAFLRALRRIIHAFDA